MAWVASRCWSRGGQTRPETDTRRGVAMLRVLILVCSIHQATADCRIDTARAVIQGPTVASEAACGLHGQAYLAGAAILASHEGAYLKIGCMSLRREQASTVSPWNVP